MNVTGPSTVANGLLPLLVTLVQARKQAHWHWKYCADEHKHRWTMVLAHLDSRIEQGEKVVGEHLDLIGFHVKRVIVE